MMPIDKLKTLCLKYREILVYLIVGILTTIFSWITCYIAKLFLDPEMALENNIINTIFLQKNILYISKYGYTD